MTEMPVERRCLTHADCYVWCGSRSEVLERHAAMFLANMRATPRKAQVVSEVDALFWSLLGGEGPIRGAPAVRKSVAQPISSGPLAEGWLWKRGPTHHFKWQRVLEAMGRITLFFPVCWPGEHFPSQCVVCFIILCDEMLGW